LLTEAFDVSLKITKNLSPTEYLAKRALQYPAKSTIPATYERHFFPTRIEQKKIKFIGLEVQ